MSFKGQVPVIEFCHRDVSRMFVTSRRPQSRVSLDQIHPFPFREPNRRHGTVEISAWAQRGSWHLGRLSRSTCYCSFTVTPGLVGRIPERDGSWTLLSEELKPQIEAGEEATEKW